MPTAPNFLAQVEAAETARRQAHETECRRQSQSGYGVDLAPFVGLTKAERRAEARRRAALWSSPDAVLKRAVIAAAEAGVPGAYSALSAADRGDANWRERARAVLAYTEARAA